MTNTLQAINTLEVKKHIEAYMKGKKAKETLILVDVHTDDYEYAIAKPLTELELTWTYIYFEADDYSLEQAIKDEEGVDFDISKYKNILSIGSPTGLPEFLNKYNNVTVMDDYDILMCVKKDYNDYGASKELKVID